MTLRIHIAKFKFRQYLLRTYSPDLVFTKLSRYMVLHSVNVVAPIAEWVRQWNHKPQNAGLNPARSLISKG